jgi:hypothetical protein
MADGTVNAGTGLSRHNGAAPPINIMTLINNENPKAWVLSVQLIAGKDPGLSAAQYGDVIGGCHGIAPFPL